MYRYSANNYIDKSMNTKKMLFYLIFDAASCNGVNCHKSIAFTLAPCYKKIQFQLITRRDILYYIPILIFCKTNS